MDLLLAVVVLLALPALWIFYLLYSNASLGRKLTYATLARSTIFPRIDCNTETSASARYTARFPADDLPRFAYNDPHLASYAISKFDKAIEALGVQNRACPGDSAVLWKVVTRHIVKGGYTREDWVSSLMSHMSSFLGFLLEDLLPDAELFTRYPALWASQKGDLNFICWTDIEEHWTRRPPFDDQDIASGGSSSRSVSPVPSHTSRSTVASESSQECSCATAPSSICTPHSPANVPTIELTTTIHTAELADVARATFHKDGQTSHAVLKTYDATGFRQVVAEVRAYETLRDLQGTTVAAQIGIIAPLHWTWVGLLMEDAGDPLGCGEDWAALGPLDRKLIYTALVKIHETDVQHGDVAPRNVVRPPDGGIAFIDFGCAEQHRCPGRDACRELLEMEKELHLT
ncbi:hypothetical protein B0H11DRAFT_2398553 [Mycena galericulata]|nr:hypothetical protein B0H11DRAFT_2398553 [Mycena galericulata]